MKPIEIQMTIKGSRIEGTLGGRPFAIIQRGCETRLEGVQGEDTLGGLLGSALLDFGVKAISGAKASGEYSDTVEPWKILNDEAADAVYEAMI